MAIGTAEIEGWETATARLMAVSERLNPPVSVAGRSRRSRLPKVQVRFPLHVVDVYRRARYLAADKGELAMLFEEFDPDDLDGYSDWFKFFDAELRPVRIYIEIMHNLKSVEVMEGPAPADVQALLDTYELTTSPLRRRVR